MAVKNAINCGRCGTKTFYRAKGFCSKCYYIIQGRDYAKEYCRKNREKILATQALYREQNGKMLREKQRNRMYQYKKENLATLKKHRELKCEVCGYDKCFAAIEFHHCDKTQKKGRNDYLGRWIYNHPPAVFKQKLLSVDFRVLCANCHREIHDNENGNNRVNK
ncbi:MAG TPA: hypothetical protein ENH40_06890 [Nitrospirae bacterium]|nr:hypothetical protein [Nitrospirota bacterium]